MFYCSTGSGDGYSYGYSYDYGHDYGYGYSYGNGYTFKDPALVNSSKFCKNKNHAKKRDHCLITLSFFVYL